MTCGWPTWRPGRPTGRWCCCCTASRAGRSCTGPCCRCWPATGCGRSRRTWSGSGGRTSRPRSPTTATPGTWSGCARWPSTGSGCSDVTLVGQDWGGLLGLRLVAEHPDRFARVVAANTGLPTGDEPMPEVWWQFRRVVEKAPALDVARLVQSGCQTRLPGPVLAGYAAPFPDASLPGRPAGDAAHPAHRPRRPGHRGQPGGVATAGGVGQAVPGRVQRPRPDHRIDGPRAEANDPGARQAGSTRSSRAPATSSRKTPARNWPRIVADFVAS